ncbi:MAG: hypothetical protein ABIH23_12235 [bacterium]
MFQLDSALVHRKFVSRHRSQLIGEIFLSIFLCYTAVIGGDTAWAIETIDLTQAVVLVRNGDLPSAERTAAQVLVEEVEKRTGLRLQTISEWPNGKPVIAVTTRAQDPGWGRELPTREGSDLPETRPEGYRLFVEAGGSQSPVVWVIGGDPRGTLFGVGGLLRTMLWANGSVQLPGVLDIATSPVYPIRGHQLGYRNKANSYDALSAEQYEQYIRELAIFGTNCIENIPFSDKNESPHMKVPRRQMNRVLSEICDRYDIDYWVWSPAEVDLADDTLRKEEFKMREQLYSDCPRIDGIFFPGGDPGDNHPKLVLPFLDDLSNILHKYHPNAKIWVSMQGFDEEQTDYFHAYVDEHKPAWLGGVVAGPSSPPIPETRRRLPEQYGLRDYPDITHSVRCQYPVVWWDPMLALILGRESCNPRPLFYQRIHRWTALYTDGFSTYSDGVHDDVNKTVWSMLGWDPEMDVREILVQYSRFFFGPGPAEAAADGIFALEKNWEGPLATNGSVEITFTHWRDLEKDFPQPDGNWRWNLCLLRAYYDALIRHRLIQEQKLEEEANQILAETDTRGIEGVMDAALAVLQSVDRHPVRPDLRKRIVDLCESLFQTIGLQTSVERYQGAGSQRGCILDFIDRPLNNRWWLEDEFSKICELSSDTEKRERLEIIRTWENPGPGSYYDDLGNIAKSPHVYLGEVGSSGPFPQELSTPTYWAWDGGFSRFRLSWLHTMSWPLGVRYENLDPESNYVLRLTGHGEAFPRVNGERIQPTVYNKKDGEFKEFPIPKHLIKDGVIEVTWDAFDEEHLNWRYQSRVAEVWLLKR